MLILNDREALSKISEKVQEGENLDELLQEMTCYLENAPAHGVAAVQFGVPKRLFLMKQVVPVENAPRDKWPHKIMTFRNPVLMEGTDPRIFKGEGCMSFPGQFRTTIRCAQVKIKDDINGAQFFIGIQAAVIQHEMDHLDGITIFDRAFAGLKVAQEPRRNAPCPCGSGLKYKRCCGGIYAGK